MTQISLDLDSHIDTDLFLYFFNSADFDELSLDFFESSVYGIPKRGSESNLYSIGSSNVGSVPVDMPANESGWGSDNSLNLSGR